MKENWINSFVKTAGFILLFSALTRFLIGKGSAQVLSLPEPLLGIPIRYAAVIVGGVELAVAFLCLFGKQIKFQIICLGWLAINCTIYYGTLFFLHYHVQATGIGSLTDPLHLSRGISGLILRFIPIYVVLGSYVAAFWLIFSKEGRVARLIATHQNDAAMDLMKMSCPACGIHIKFARQNLGQKIPCPHCQREIALRKPENLKMSCFFCKEHIEFPAHALGEKISCPHCKMNITLKEQV